MNHSLGKILISQNLESAQEYVEKNFDIKLKKTFFRDELKVDDVKEIIREAYIAENQEKLLIISAKNYNIYSQNALLKMLEEPPRNIIFTLIAKSKTAFLPTIISRLPIEYLKSEKNEIDLGLNLKNLTLEDIYNFVQKHKNISKSDLKDIIQAILVDSIQKYKIKLLESELELFNKSLELANLNTRAEILLNTILLTILNRQKK